jgi:ParB family transcriptional regulator, chromosome partitioning protein
MVRHKGLGRGLDALLSGDESVEKQGDRLTDLPLTALQPGKYQPRTQMHEEAIVELADSLKSQGMIQPILARPVGAGRYEIIAGERRWRAAQKAGLKEVPVLVREVRDEAALAMALIENIQRENLNALEEAAGIQRLIDEFGMTHQTAGEAVGRSRTAVTNLVRLLQLPAAVQQKMMNGELDMGHGRALLGLPTAKQLELADRIAAKGLSVREAERLVAHAANDEGVKPRRVRPNRDVQDLEEELSDVLGATVKIRPGAKGRGKLVVEYRSLDQFEALLARLRR